MAETAALESLGRAGLHQEVDLEQALDWQRDNRPGPAWARRYPGDFNQSMAFLERSRDAHEKEEQQKEKDRLERERLLREKAELAEQQVQQEREARRKSRRWAGVMGALAALMLAAAGFAWFSWNEADYQSSVAFSPDGRLLASASADRTVRLSKIGIDIQ